MSRFDVLEQAEAVAEAAQDASEAQAEAEAGQRAVGAFLLAALPCWWFAGAVVGLVILSYQRRKDEGMKYLENMHTGEIHKLDEDGRSNEECNVDAIEASEELDEEEALTLLSADPALACRHCCKEETDG